MLKYSIAALLLISLTACGGNSSDKSELGNGTSSTTSNGTGSATSQSGDNATVTFTTPGQATSPSSVVLGNIGNSGSSTDYISSSSGATVHITSGNGTDIISASGNTTSSVTISGSSLVTLASGNGYVTLNPSGVYTISLVAGPDLEHFVTIAGIGAGDTIKTGAPIINSSWLAAGKTATVSFDANEVQVPDPATASLADYANYAVRTVAMQAGDAAWFTFGGDTYLVENVHGEEYNFTGGTDVLVKLAGPVNLSNATIVGGAVVLQ